MKVRFRNRKEMSCCREKCKLERISNRSRSRKRTIALKIVI